MTNEIWMWCVIAGVALLSSIRCRTPVMFVECEHWRMGSDHYCLDCGMSAREIHVELSQKWIDKLPRHNEPSPMVKITADVNAFRNAMAGLARNTTMTRADFVKFGKALRGKR